MLTDDDVPFCLDEINEQWLTKACRDGHIISADEQVKSFTQQVIGGAAGFNGEVAIFRLQYSNPDTDAPATMVLKIPTALKNRILGQTMGLYEKEIRFYRDVASELRIRVPRHYYSALDEADDPDVIAERMVGLNKMPIWLIGILSKVATWMVARTPRRYALLIEDLSDYRMGDQMENCSSDDIRRVLAGMAQLHAQFWESEKLAAMSWIMPVTSTSKIMQLMFRQTLATIRSAPLYALSEEQQRIVTWLNDNGVALAEVQGSEPSTLLHGDIRLDNICFDDEQNEALLFDWQTMQRGPAGMDLAYFISATIPADASQQSIDEWLQFYHGQLQAHGVKMSLDRLRWQYEIGILSMVHRILPTAHQNQMDLGAERGPRMMQAWLDKIFSKAERINYQTILGRMPGVDV